MPCERDRAQREESNRLVQVPSTNDHLCLPQISSALVWLTLRAACLTIYTDHDRTTSTPLLRDRNSIYGREVVRTIHNLCAEQLLAAPRSPWQNPYVERVIGSIRRECLDHVIVVNENHLRKFLKEYSRCYTESRTHLALGKDCPEPREIEPPEMSKIVAVPQIGGLYHRYTRTAA